jgi:predicted  nucleic acid-binding Zn-ribbon protein
MDEAIKKLEAYYGCPVILVKFPFECIDCGRICHDLRETMTGRHCVKCGLKYSKDKKKWSELTRARPVDINELKIVTATQLATLRR